jgi:hypothetical protein
MMERDELADSASQGVPAPGGHGTGIHQHSVPPSEPLSPCTDTSNVAAVTEVEGNSELDVLIQRVAELEMRLRERVEENIRLHEEVRSLLAERRVRDEYIESIEEEGQLALGELVTNMRNSTSWRVTKPLRFVGSTIHRGWRRLVR